MSESWPYGIGVTPNIDLDVVRSQARVGIAYSGGGDRIAVHLGIVKAFIEAGIVPHYITGSSAGAYACVFHALDPTSLKHFPLAIRMVQKALPLLRPSRFGLIFRLLPSLLKGLLFGAAAIDLLSLNTNDRMRRLLQRSMPIQSFSGLNVPISISATELLTGKEAWFDSDATPLPLALLASSAIPALFPPVEVNGKLYVDGTVSDNLPLFRLAEQGCKVIYACNVGYAGETAKPPANLLDVVLQSESIGQFVDDTREQQVLALRYPEIRVIPVRPNIELQSLPSEIIPENVGDIIDATARETRRILAAAMSATPSPQAPPAS